MSDFYETVARFYDAENETMTEDLALYDELAEQVGGPVLDIGSGTGRVTFHLAQAGCQVVGLERSAAMLARAGRKLALRPDLQDRVRFMPGDLLDGPPPGPFRLILVTYNAFMHFAEQTDQLKALAGLRAALADDGVLVLDLPNAAQAYAALDDSTLTLERTFIEPESGHLVMQQSVSEIDRANQRLRVRWIYDEIDGTGAIRRTLAPVSLRYVFAAEMDLLLAASGLHRLALYGDYDRSRFEDGCPRMIVLARRA